MHSFIFRGRSSRDFPLIVQDLGKRQRGEQDIEELPVPYASRSVIVAHESYLPYTRTMQLVLSDYLRLGDIASWLRGYGRLETSLDQGFFFRAYVESVGQVTRFSGDHYQFSVTFIVDPYAFMLIGEDPIILTGTSTVFNPSNVSSAPLMAVQGSGGTVRIGSQSFTLNDVPSGRITIDSERQIAYHGTQNRGEHMSGDFLEIPPGESLIEISGGITEIELRPRWREL